MNTILKKSYFASDASSYYYMDDNHFVRSGDLINIMDLHGTNHPEFERFILEMNAGRIGVCLRGEYVVKDADSDKDEPFKHITDDMFKKLIVDQDTIRLRYDSNNVMLIQYNASVLTDWIRQ